ncbi:phosphatidate cytidylyltransferase [Candidatus Hoaglandella endobia]|uniref:Phosphatidate cytidylyltransferase n=1 Tax=Candidatus Hoaglandella endobia TaxID=1778263 RepID=A0A143WU78_9ENTR|nr:phosphatidate cytidylyltransferase [Candidatus Hoaglandella endobia]CUX97265.1 Phosphatidate cytidylyltransferase [Candidatus Hoaglandella endobia]
MLKSRLVTAFILIPIVIAALFLLSPIKLVFVSLAVCMLSAWEWGQLAGLSSRSQRIWLLAISFCSLLLALMIFNLPDYLPFMQILQAQYVLWAAAIIWWQVALLLVLYYPNSATFWRNSKTLLLVFGSLTILPFFWGILALRQYHYGINHFIGAWLLLYVIVLVWGADSGAYILGRMIGRHKLAPKISPAKTWEGLVGGLITSSIIAWIFVRYTPIIDAAAPLALLICSMVAFFVSVLGDLTESMFKREAGIKDSSHLIPGHGGILDRIDGLMAAVPVFAGLMLLVFNAI